MRLAEKLDWKGLRSGKEGMGCIDLAQGRGRWRAVVNAVMNIWVPYIAVNFLTSLENV
jgi:hypothetical protein